MKTKIALTVTLLALAGLAFYTNTTAFAQPAPDTDKPTKNPLILKAQTDLEDARNKLRLAKELAKQNFGGHCDAAIKACDQAIAECKAALDHDKK